MIKSFLDKLIFSVGVICFLQLPHFVDHYTQRLGGYYTAQSKHLAQYQTIADESFSGNLHALIANFLASETKAIQKTGATIDRISQEVDELAGALVILQDGNLVNKIRYLAVNLDSQIFYGTLENIKPGIPISFEAFVSALIGGLIFSILFHGLVALLRLTYQTLTSSDYHLRFKPAESI